LSDGTAFQPLLLNKQKSPEAGLTELRPARAGLQGMSIDKDSDGVPEVDLSKRTTKVNLSVIVAVVVFFVIGGIAMWWWVTQRGTP
jgi:hypothetical protein